MPDPAVEAAQRAWKDDDSHAWMGPIDIVMAASREALKPIRRLHYKLRNHNLCATCWRDNRGWPCETARLIYTTEELER